MKQLIPVLLILFILSPLTVFSAGKSSATPPKDAKCPVCGMFVAKYPDWISTMTFRDGSTLYFDGPKDLFRFYKNPVRYGSKKRSPDVTVVRVKDYYTLDPIDGLKAYYVIGSDVLGPMGRELVPFSGEEDAGAFLKDHGGKKVLRFHDIDATVLKSLD